MRTLVNKLENLNPAYFALVMSTGIISIAAHYQGTGSDRHNPFQNSMWPLMSSYGSCISRG